MPGNAEAIARWVPIVGRWEFPSNGEATYLGPEEKHSRPYGICVSKSRFSEGEVRLQIILPKKANRDHGPPSGRLLLGYTKTDSDYYIAGLGGYGKAYTLTRYDRDRGWIALAYAGNESDLICEREYKLSARVRGQRVTLEDDGIRILDHVLEGPLPAGQLGLFGWGEGPVEFTGTSVSETRGDVFVVMQFSGRPYQELYTDVIKKVAEADPYKLRAYPADEVFGPGLILEDVIRGIVEAKIVIAEITQANKNVFYELGYTHALKKPTILLAGEGYELPFDIKGFRCLFYEGLHRRKREG